MLLNIILIVLELIFAINGDVIVTTKYGQIRGMASHALNKTIHEFLGIRYAESPVGSLRFKKPEPVKSWDGIYNATKMGHICPQSKNSLNEDCLFLNVMSTVTESRDLKPVMFWIHGGALKTGSGSISPILASHDIVLVGINYRLGPFGFLYGGSDEAPGNVGFWDQALALKWVKENIKSFGGNPEAITIFGQSAGGQSVGHLVTSPVTRNSFKRAILQSGASCYYTGKGTADKSLNLHDAKHFANIKGCNDHDWIQCLKKLDTEKILQYDGHLYIDRPITGDEFMPENSQKALKSGHFKTGVEIMAGVVANEGTIYALRHLPKLADSNYHLTKETVHHIVMNLNNVLHKRLTPQIDVESVYKLYISNVSENDQLKLRRSFSQIFGEFILKCPTYFFAKEHALYSDSDTVYFYLFNHRVSLPSEHCKHWMGVCHADDMAFVFGNPLTPSVHNPYPEEDIQLSRLVMHIWTTFAKTGAPFSSTLPVPNDIHIPGVNLSSIQWTPFRKLHVSQFPVPVVPTAMVIDIKNFGKMVNEPFKENCDGFWKPYFL